MTDIVERLLGRARWHEEGRLNTIHYEDMRAGELEPDEDEKLHIEAAAEIGQLRQIYFDLVKEQADEIERLRDCLRARDHELQTVYGEIERLRALLKRHDDCWRLLHSREYTGALRDDTRAALGDEQLTKATEDAS